MKEKNRITKFSEHVQKVMPLLCALRRNTWSDFRRLRFFPVWCKWLSSVNSCPLPLAGSSLSKWRSRPKLPRKQKSLLRRSSKAPIRTRCAFCSCGGWKLAENAFAALRCPAKPWRSRSWSHFVMILSLSRWICYEMLLDSTWFAHFSPHLLCLGHF